MKKFFISLLALTFTIPAFCEAIKLKNGLIVNGSIIDRSEYILKVQTSYGVISLNQREIEKIMPDLHRVFLKGGGEYVGTIVDLDDFNLTLNTDNGLVNIDVAQITSMEIYDYEEAAKQKKYVETKIEQEEQEKAEEDKKQKAVVTTLGTSGLNFDEDLEKVFPSKPQETEEIKYIYKTHEDTPEQIRTETEENTLTPAEQEQKEKEEAIFFDQNKKRKEGKNYFATHIGMLKTKLNADISDLDGPTDFEVSGSGVSFGVTYLRKLTNRFWYGGGFDFGMLPKQSVRYSYMTTPYPGEERDTQISGQIYDLNALFNFYINPQKPVRVYLTGGVNVTSIGIDRSYADLVYDSVNDNLKWNSPKTDNSTQTVFGGNAGLGVEWTVEDINIGLETRVKYTTLKKEFSNSPKTSVLITLKASWFF